ncbi:hypothetical protein [Photobacterium damselae]|uniref:hypothetical protein n=1 Tax=Photobacterium damselae TaxID=38293 RepID=UPI000DD42CF3|nr:hypothetical protein [Photobacterium damselae]NVO74242.1 hypothetical protein [Photobacterium damselae subsp. damselae]
MLYLKNNMEYIIDIVSFLRANNFNWNDWKLSKSVVLTESLKQQFLNYDEKELLEFECIGHDKKLIDIEDVIVGSTIIIECSLPRANSLFVAKDIFDLVSKTSLLNKIENYIIYDIDYVSWRDKEEDYHDVFSYEKICAFILLCIDHSVLEHHHETNKLVLYFSNTKLIIPCELCARSLKGTVGQDFNEIIKKFENDKHRSDKVHMLRASLYTILNKCNESKRLTHIINKSSNFLKLFEQNYDLFMTEFCFNTEKDKIFEAKREFITKLNQLLSGIQAKILAIPLSLVLVLGQMKTKPEDNPFLINSLIISSSVIFTVTMLFLLFSQLSAVSAIKQEVKSKKSRFELELSDLYDDVAIAFESVLKQCLYNRWFIIVMMLIVSLGLVGSFIAYIILTPEVKIFLYPYYNAFLSYFKMTSDSFSHISILIKDMKG